MLLVNVLKKSEIDKHIKKYDLVPEHLECQMCMTCIDENNDNNKNGYVYYHYDELVCNNQKCKIEWYEFQEKAETHKEHIVCVIKNSIQQAEHKKKYQEFKKEQMAKY